MCTYGSISEEGNEELVTFVGEEVTQRDQFRYPESILHNNGEMEEDDTPK